MLSYLEILLLIVMHIPVSVFGKLYVIGLGIGTFVLLTLVDGILILSIGKANDMIREYQRDHNLRKYEVTIECAHVFEVIAENEEDAFHKALGEADRITFRPQWELNNITEL